METVQTGEMVKGKAAISENVSKAAMGRRVVLWHGKGSTGDDGGVAVEVCDGGSDGVDLRLGGSGGWTAVMSIWNILEQFRNHIKGAQMIVKPSNLYNCSGKSEDWSQRIWDICIIEFWRAENWVEDGGEAEEQFWTIFLAQAELIVIQDVLQKDERLQLARGSSFVQIRSVSQLEFESEDIEYERLSNGRFHCKQTFKMMDIKIFSKLGSRSQSLWKLCWIWRKRITSRRLQLWSLVTELKTAWKRKTGSQVTTSKRATKLPTVMNAGCPAKDSKAGDEQFPYLNKETWSCPCICRLAYKSPSPRDIHILVSSPLGDNTALSADRAPPPKLPSKRQMNNFAAQMHAAGLGKPPSEYTGHQGNLVYLNDLHDVLGQRSTVSGHKIIQNGEDLACQQSEVPVHLVIGHINIFRAFILEDTLRTNITPSYFIGGKRIITVLLVLYADNSSSNRSKQ
ncbi:hypothetical protein BT69DRAFT_1322205 [Atractiella rhizophila]|nr:hypothetical protein BT69DRAFT_1322205 [Atractiella rhizophila]